MQLKPTYFPNLDATRFIAFLHVFLAHCFYTNSLEISDSRLFEIFSKNIKAGFLGLDYFFVLSSFLLTFLILEEENRTGTFRSGFFLIRRGIRLWPLYFLLVFCTYLGYSIVTKLGANLHPLPPIEVYLLFVSNLWIVQNGQEFLFLLVLFWSIAVEEQFYVFWAIAMKFFRKYIPHISFGLIGISLLFRFYFIEQQPVLAFHTVSTLGNFGIGALGAWLAFTKHPIMEKIVKLRLWQSATVYAILLILVLFYYRLFDFGWPVVIEKIVFALFFLFVILEQSFSKTPLVNFGKFALLSYMGRISLGLYCFHGLALTLYKPLSLHLGLTNESVFVFVLNPAVLFIFTVFTAVLSYEWVEKPIYNLRNKFR